jgi:cytochrome c biogenesis protein CcmG/thiol:disulfide interchange protein DsbE
MILSVLRIRRFSLAAVMAIVGAIFAAAAQPARAMAPGDEAPEIAVTQADGTPMQLSALRGKTVYLDFWASWCGPCRQSFPWMNAMHEKYSAAGLAIVAINVDKRRTDAEKFLAQFPARFSIVYDQPGATPPKYDVRKMPTSVLIDGRGRIVSTHSGFSNEVRDELEARIRTAVAARPPG